MLEVGECPQAGSTRSANLPPAAWIRPPGRFALYVAGYSGYRIFEETIRIDSSAHVLGLRLNFFVAVVVTLAGLAWFAVIQRRGRPPLAAASRPPPGQHLRSGGW